MKANVKMAAAFLYDIFLRHPNENGMGYLRHFFKTMKMSYQMGAAAIALIIHAFFPKYFETFGETTIERLSMEHLSNELVNSNDISNKFNEKDD
jgi:hypothetical protein